MKKVITIIALLKLILVVGCKNNQKVKPPKESVETGQILDFNKMILPSPSTAKLTNSGYFVWGTSMVKSHIDGKYHVFYSRWPKETMFKSWVTHSEIAHGVGDNPLGPFTFVDVALPERGREFWDGLCTHNPNIKYFQGKYYLYYMGNTGDRSIPEGKTNGGDVPVEEPLNWLHRNNQRIGLAVAENPNGPWIRKDVPLIDISKDDSAPDALMTSNPTVTKRIGGGYLMVYKSVGKKLPPPFGGPVSILTATADSPDGPFNKQLKPIFQAESDSFPAEDPFIWTGKDCYYAIVKDMNGAFTNVPRSCALFVSKNGMDWEPAKNPFVSKMEIQWEESETQQVKHLERPQLFLEDGEPTVILFAATTDYDDVFNVQMPLSFKKDTFQVSYDKGMVKRQWQWQ